MFVIMIFIRSCTEEEVYVFSKSLRFDSYLNESHRIPSSRRLSLITF